LIVTPLISPTLPIFASAFLVFGNVKSFPPLLLPVSFLLPLWTLCESLTSVHPSRAGMRGVSFRPPRPLGFFNGGCLFLHFPVRLNSLMGTLFQFCFPSEFRPVSDGSLIPPALQVFGSPMFPAQTRFCVGCNFASVGFMAGARLHSRALVFLPTS